MRLPGIALRIFGLEADIACYCMKCRYALSRRRSVMTCTRVVRQPTADDIQQAARLIASILPMSPVDAPADTPAFYLKLESLQPTGSFKVRGALAALERVAPDRPVVTASAGNHALGIAYAATRLHRKATVVTSTTAADAKIAAIRRSAVELIQVGTSFDEAEAYALDLAAREDFYYVSAYNDAYVIAGQASIGFELGKQLEGPLTVVCGIGGGGLASGLGLWASTRDDVRIVGVESAASTALSTSVRAGQRISVSIGTTLADGLAGNIEAGSVTIDLVHRYVHDLVAVSEDEISRAVRYLALNRGVIAEGAGAVGVAAVLAGRVSASGKTVVVVSGRNISPGVLAGILTS
jgi:threonine dehydratase